MSTAGRNHRADVGSGDWAQFEAAARGCLRRPVPQRDVTDRAGDPFGDIPFTGGALQKAAADEHRAARQPVAGDVHLVENFE